MATARDKVVQHLQNARAAEFALSTQIATSIGITPEGRHQRWLESQRGYSRDREYRLADRLSELGARRSLGYLGLNTVRVLGEQTATLVMVPLQLLRGPGGEDRILENARDLCAAAAMQAANYRALEQIAHTARDEITAKLAVDLRAETEEVLSECFSALDRVADSVITGEIAGEQVPAAAGALQSLQLSQLRESFYRLRDEAADAIRSARQSSATRVEARSIIPDYDRLSADGLRDRLSHLPQSNLAVIETYERRTRNRQEVLEIIRDQRGKEPWPGYDEMNPSELRSRLRDATDQGWVRSVIDYERNHRNRPSVVESPEAQSAAQV